MLDSSANDRHIDGCGCSACQAEPQFEFVEDRNPQAASPTFSNSQVIGQISSSSVWSGNSISFGFLQSSPSWDIGYEGDGFSAFNSTQISATRLGISLWDDLINDSFVEAVSNQQNANIKFGNTTTYISFAHAYFPGGSPWAGEVWLNANTYTYLQFPDVLGEGSLSYAYMTIIHEIGHALGLNHPGNYNGGSPTYANDAEYAQDTHQWTVMSYFSASNTGADWNGGDGGWGYAQTPMVHDILTIQSMYGADTSTRSDSTTYGFNTDTNLAVYDFTQNSAPRLTIYDAGGIDTLDLSGFQNRAIINLQPGTYSSAGGTTSTMTHNIGIAHNTWIENAIGGSGNDTIYGNALTNTLTGNAGNDSLYGYDGNDTFFGGSGTDWVYFEGALLDYVVTVLDTSLEFLDTFTDSVWNDVEWIQFTDASYTYSDLENLFREEIEIESNGVLKLLILGGRYRLEDTDGTTSEITYNGSPVGPNTFAGWQATQVEANNNGGYDLLFLHTNGSNIVWQLDNSGVHIGHNLVSPDELIDYETVFNVDLNSDGQLGHVTTTVEDAGSYKLLSQSSGKYLIENAEGTTSEITYNGSPVGPNTFAGWQATQVEANNNGGYDLLFLHTNGSNIVWQLDNSGVHIGHNLVSPDELIDYETVFNVDLNSDGHLGVNNEPFSDDLIS